MLSFVPMVMFGQLPAGKVPDAGGLTPANGSAWGSVKGISTVPLAQCVLAGIPPTAAIGLAFTSDDPVAMAALIDVELVIMPQPRSTSALPVAVMPVVDVFSRL